METIQPLHIILIVLLTLFFASCERLGIEVATVKGEWQSEPYGNEYVKFYIVDDEMLHITYKDGKAIKGGKGTWSLNKDTLSLYQQSPGSDGIRKFKIEKMTMNSLTLRNLSNEDVWIMTRQYPTEDNDYNSRFNYVFDLKKGFWWYAWTIPSLIIGMVTGAGIIGFIVSLLSKLYNLGKKLINKRKGKNDGD